MGFDLRLRGPWRRIFQIRMIDLIAEFDPAKQFSLLEMVGLENRLADILGERVDLTPARALKDRVRERVAREAVLAF